jgi:PilZ domain
MESKRYIVYNKARETFLTSAATSVNAALEPLKVLKVLIEGLPANARTGLWLTNFKGVPVARTLSPFDLIYLDKNHCTLHSLELSKDAEFAPFKGQPASALVLPPGSISSSKTRDGDELELRPVDTAVPEAPAEADAALTTPESKRSAPTEDPLPVGTRFYSSAGQTGVSPVDNAPLERFVSAQSSHAANEGPGSEVPVASAEMAAIESASQTGEPEAASAAGLVTSSAPVPAGQGRMRRLVTGPILGGSPARKPSAPPAETPASTRAPIPFPTTPATRNPGPRIQEASPHRTEIPIHLSPQQRSAARPVEEPSSAAAPATPAVPGPTPARSPAPPRIAPKGIPIVSEPVAPPAEIGEPEPLPDYAPEPKRKFSWRIRALRWLFPDLVIHESPKPRDRRRADRQSLPGLIAYFFTGGAPEPHKIRNISVTGFFLETEDRWMPGTVVRMTLQKLGSKGDDPSDTITVNSRIVRWGPDGEGFEFILTDLDE